jgi:transcriptional regulator with XRE-family HTH domain
MDDDHTTSTGSTTFDQALGRTIQVLRTDRGQSRRDLADRADISYSYLSAIENGTKAASSRTVAAIAGSLGVHRHELVAAAEARFVPTRFSLRDEVGASAMPAEPLTDRSPPRSDPGRLEELRSLLDVLDDDDAEFLVQMARRLASHGRRRRHR